jgi:hypothetical protein
VCVKLVVCMFVFFYFFFPFNHECAP